MSQTRYDFIVRFLDKTQSGFRSFESNVDKAYQKTKTFEKQHEGLIKTAQSSAVAFGAVALSVGALGKKMLMSAADAEETTNRFNAVFADQADQASKYVDQVASSLGRASTEVQDSLSSFQGFFVGLGIGGEQSTQLSTKIHSLSLDFASFNNLSDGEAQQRFISALSGSGEVLDRFGINIKQAALDQELMKMGFEGGAASAGENEKALARLNIIMESMGRQGAIGDAVKTSDTFVGTMKRLRGQVVELSQSIGKELIPIVKPLITGIANLATKFNEMSPGSKKMIAYILAGTVAFAGLGLAITGIIALAPGFILVAKGIGLAITLMGGPISILIGAIGALALAWKANFMNIQQWTAVIGGGIISTFVEVSSFFTDWFLKIKKGFGTFGAGMVMIWNNVGSAFEKTILYLKQGFGKFVDTFLADKVNTAIDVLNKIPGIEIEQMKTMAQSSEDFAKERAKIDEKYAQKKTDLLNAYAEFEKDSLAESTKNTEKWNKQRQNILSATVELNKDFDAGKAVKGPKIESDPFLGQGGFDMDAVLAELNRLPSATDASGESIAKVGEKLKDLQADYVGTAGKAKQELEQLEQAHREKTDTIKGKIEELNESLRELEKNYKATIGGLDQSLGNKVVEQEENIKSLKDSVKELNEEIGKMQNEKGKAKEDDDKKAIEERIKDAQEELKKKQDLLKQEEDALTGFMEKTTDLDDEIAEARRRHELTGFERFVEDIEQKKAMEEEQYLAKKAQIDQEIADQQKALEEETAIYEEKKALYEEALSVFESMVKGMETGYDNLNNKTQKTVDEMKAKLEELKATLQAIKALTAPKEGPDRRTLADVGKAYGAIDPTGAGVFESYRATGGMVSANKPYVVGERGEELFVPRTAGSIVPSDKLQNTNSPIHLTIQVSGNTIDSSGRIEEILDLAEQRFVRQLELANKGIN